MLKVELERRLQETEDSRAHFLAENSKLERAIKNRDIDIEKFKQQLENSSEQLKQISQSIYTMLQVKYPDIYNQEIAQKEIDEDKNFLIFLHGLCVCNDYTNNKRSF